MSSKNKLSTLGFTLIELLVVISIIGLISTIVLVSTKGSRDKARLAKVKQFSSQVNHALGAYAVGIWRFEEGEGIDIHDESGYGNHGTFHGNPTPVFPDGVYSGTTALQFDGIDDYVDCGNDESLNITDEITISAWVKIPSTTTFEQEICGKWGVNGGTANYGAYVIGLKSTNQLFFKIDDVINGSGIWESASFPVDNWQHVAATFNGSNAYLYRNASQVASWSGSGVIPTSGNNVIIGNIAGFSLFFNGAIDEVRIYNRALSAAEIRKHYAAGAAKHGIALNDR